MNGNGQKMSLIVEAFYATPLVNTDTALGLFDQRFGQAYGDGCLWLNKFWFKNDFIGDYIPFLSIRK